MCCGFEANQTQRSPNLLFYFVYYALREQQRHTLFLYLKRISVAVTAGTAEEQIKRDDILSEKNIKLPHIRVLRVFNLLVSEEFLVILNRILHLNPECLAMLYGKVTNKYVLSLSYIHHSTQ